MKSVINQELLQYTDKWVAISSDYSRIVASGDSIPEVEKKLKGKKADVNNLIITYVNPPTKFLSPHGNSNV